MLIFSRQELGRLDKAETSYRQAIALKPGFAEAYNNLGIVLENLGLRFMGDVQLAEARAFYGFQIAMENTENLQR